MAIEQTPRFPLQCGQQLMGLRGQLHVQPVMAEVLLVRDVDSYIDSWMRTEISGHRIKRRPSVLECLGQRCPTMESYRAVLIDGDQTDGGWRHFYWGIEREC